MFSPAPNIFSHPFHFCLHFYFCLPCWNCFCVFFSYLFKMSLSTQILPNFPKFPSPTAVLPYCRAPLSPTGFVCLFSQIFCFIFLFLFPIVPRVFFLIESSIIPAVTVNNKIARKGRNGTRGATLNLAQEFRVFLNFNISIFIPPMFSFHPVFLPRPRSVFPGTSINSPIRYITRNF